MVVAVRAQVSGLSMASTAVAPSAPSYNRGVIIVKAQSFRPSFFGYGGNCRIYCNLCCKHGLVVSLLCYRANPFVLVCINSQLITGEGQLPMTE